MKLRYEINALVAYKKFDGTIDKFPLPNLIFQNHQGSTS